MVLDIGSRQLAVAVHVDSLDQFALDLEPVDLNVSLVRLSPPGKGRGESNDRESNGERVSSGSSQASPAEKPGRVALVGNRPNT